jgi:hypothetical protein
MTSREIVEAVVERYADGFGAYVAAHEALTSGKLSKGRRRECRRIMRANRVAFEGFLAAVCAIPEPTSEQRRELREQSRQARLELEGAA